MHYPAPRRVARRIHFLKNILKESTLSVSNKRPGRNAANGSFDQYGSFRSVNTGVGQTHFKCRDANPQLQNQEPAEVELHVLMGFRWGVRIM